jgi:hypothetical protein
MSERESYITILAANGTLFKNEFFSINYVKKSKLNTMELVLIVEMLEDFDVLLQKVEGPENAISTEVLLDEDLLFTKNSKSKLINVKINLISI